MRMNVNGSWGQWGVDVTGLTAVVALTLLAVVLGIKPVLDERQAYAERGQEAERKREHVSTVRATSSEARTQLARMERAIEASELHLAPVGRLNRRMAALADLAEASGLDLEQIQPGEAASGRHHTVVPIRLAGSADYAACARFLHELAEAFADVTLGTMELRSAPRDGERVAEYHFTLNWHAAATAGDGGGEP